MPPHPLGLPRNPPSRQKKSLLGHVRPSRPRAQPCDNWGCSGNHELSECPIGITMCKGCGSFSHTWSQCPEHCDFCECPHHNSAMCYRIPVNSDGKCRSGVEAWPFGPLSAWWLLRGPEVQPCFDLPVGECIPDLPPDPHPTLMLIQYEPKVSSLVARPMDRPNSLFRRHAVCPPSPPVCLHLKSVFEICMEG